MPAHVATHASAAAHRPRHATGATAFRSGPAKLTPAALSLHAAKALPLPDALLESALASDAGAPAVDWVVKQLHDVRRARAEHIAPKDLEGAHETAKTLGEFLFAFGTGPRSSHVSSGGGGLRERLAEQNGRRVSFKELPELLPRALTAFMSGYAKRKSGLNDTLYRMISEAALNHLAHRYFDEVVLKGVPSATFLASVGVGRDDATPLRDAMAPLLPKPSRDEVAALYRLNVDGKLGVKDFYLATGLDPDGVKALQASDPVHFPRGTDRERDALSNHHATKTAHDVDQLERDFKQRVVHDGLSVTAFLHEEGIRPEAWAELRRNNPTFHARQRYADEAIDAVARRAQELFKADPLMSQDELLKALNADKKLVAGHGSIEPQRYRQMHRLSPEKFPDLRTGWVEPAVKVLERLTSHAKGHVADAELVAGVAKELPGFTLSNLRKLREMGRIPGAGIAARRHGEQMKPVHHAIAEIIEKEPSLSASEIARRLEHKGLKLSPTDAGRVVGAVRPRSVFAGRDFQHERNSQAMRDLLQLVVRVHPPGTPMRELLEAWDGELKKRGLPSMHLEHRPNLDSWAAYFWSGPEQSPSAHSAKVTAQVLGEYAAAAPKTDSHDAIVARVLHDYPTLDLHRLSSYLKLWRASPKQYPGVARFIGKDGKLELHGLNHPVAAPRFVGGFTFERGVMGGEGEEKVELARLSQSTQVPLRLPDLDAMVDDLHGREPLAHVHFLWVGHLVSDAVAMSFALREAGLSPGQAEVVGTPYGTNEVVKATLEREGFSVTRPELKVTAYPREVEAAFDRIVAKARHTHHPIIVLDDGGLTVEVLRKKVKEDPKTYGPIAARVRVVEQTTGGINLEEREALPVPVVAVARSRSKQLEGGYIGEVIAEKIMQRLGADLAGKQVVVGGYGVVGRQIAAQLLARGAHVSVVEANPQAASEVKPPLHLKSKDDALKNADLVIGATGNPDVPFMGVADFKHLKDGAVFLSASSKRGEADMAGLLAASDARTPVASESPLVSLPTAEYQLGRKRITVLGDGWPVNFDGGIQSVPPALIGVTDAALFGGVLQAVKAGGRKGIEPLDEVMDATILARHEQLLRGAPRPKVYDPGKWEDDVRALAEAMKPPRR